MHFDLDEDQSEIKRTARELLTARCTPDRVREHAESRTSDDALWGELVELGWPGIAIPEEHGGAGLGVVAAMCVAEELGRALAPVPFLPTAAAALLVADAGSPEQRRTWLPQLAAGRATATVGLARDGRAELVADAPSADLVVLVEDGGASLVPRVEATVQAIDTIDRTRSYGAVSGRGEALPGDPTLGLARAEALLAAEMVGIAERALEMSVAYAGERTQFGRPIGAFQAVAHRCADMLVDVEGARSAVYHAAWAGDASPSTLPLAAGMALATAAEAARRATASATQVHGGIGFTWEADLHWLLKRAQLDSILLGSPGEHHLRTGRLLASAGRAAA